MCLFATTKNPKLAKKDIKCYKVVKTYTYPDGTVHYTSIFGSTARTLRYEVGKEISMNEKLEPEYHTQLQSMVRNNDDIRVNAGLHTFKPDCEGWIDVAHWGLRFFNEQPEDEIGIPIRNKKSMPFTIGIDVLECVIPEGTLYFEGKSNCVGSPDEKSYASEKLRVIRVIDNVWKNKKPSWVK